jgi:hypothetical protein
MAVALPAQGHPSGNSGQVAVPVVPFVNGAHEHVEPAFQFNVVPGANGQDFGPFDVPAYGYLRHLLISVSGAGGTIGAGVLSGDYPFNIFERVALLDVNGSPIFELDGYALFIANLLGGYAYTTDPRRANAYDGTLNTQFALRIPVEINHFDGLGSVSNQNSAAAYKIAIRVRPSTQLYSTAPTTIPTLTIRGELEAWSLPNETDLAGRPQEQEPPLHGTSQYWSSTTPGVNAGANTTRLTRVGNMLRNVIFIARTAAGVRSDTVFPDPATLSWDGNQLFLESQANHLRRLTEKLLNPLDRPVGVFAYPFSHSEDNSIGDGPPSLWLATVGSSRIEVTGNSAAAGTLQIVTNDVAPVETVPTERYELPSRTGLAGVVARQG